MFVNVKKTLIQFLLLLLLVSIVTYTFFFYFYKEENLKENKVQISKSAEPEISDETASLIKGIDYSFNDPNGNRYQILSEFGKIDLDKPGGEASVNALNLTKNDEHADNNILINHKSEHCNSSQNVRNILQNKSEYIKIVKNTTKYIKARRITPKISQNESTNT